MLGALLHWCVIQLLRGVALRMSVATVAPNHQANGLAVAIKLSWGVHLLHTLVDFFVPVLFVWPLTIALLGLGLRRLYALSIQQTAFGIAIYVVLQTVLTTLFDWLF